MADRVYLSLWLENFSSATMLSLWAKALAEFPVSTLSPGVRELTVYPFQWSEAPVLEQSFPEGTGVAEALRLAAEFHHDDYAYEAKLHWDVWVLQESGSLDQWERVAQTVAVSCVGPQFESEDIADHPHLLFDLGLDTLFLPDNAEPEELQAALEGVAGNCYRENISQLLSYVQRLEKTLAVARRLLWSSSGEDLAEHIRTAYGQ